MARKIQKRKENVIIKFIGKGDKGYYLKEQVEFNKKNNINHMFKKVLEYSSEPEKLPINVQKRLS